MKKLIKIEDVLFSDGIIEKYQFKVDDLNMYFKDYADTELIFNFSGNIKVQEQKGLGASIYESRLEKLDRRYRLRLLDDDLTEMLNIEFGSCEISLL